MKCNYCDGKVVRTPFVYKSSIEGIGNIDALYKVCHGECEDSSWMDEEDEDDLNLKIYQIAKEKKIENKTIDFIESILIKRKILPKKA